MSKDNKSELFVAAIRGTQKLKITFDSKESGVITRTVIPMDIGPWKRIPGSTQMRYHMIDLDSTAGQHPLSVLPEQIVSMDLLAERFNPEDFVRWTPSWHTARDWGVLS